MEVKEEDEKCGICDSKISGEETGTVVITTSDGDLEMKLCSECYQAMDMYVDMIEEIENENI